MFGEQGWRITWITVQSRLLLPRLWMNDFNYAFPIIKLYWVLWSLSNIFKEVKATVATRMEMSVKQHGATNCSSWAVAERFLF